MAPVDNVFEIESFGCGCSNARHGQLHCKKHDVSQLSATWPYCCKYYDAKVMDGPGANGLLTCDTDFRPSVKHLSYIDMTEAGPIHRHASPTKAGLKQLADLTTIPELGSRVIFIPQRRIYHHEYSHVRLPLEQSTWRMALSSFSIPPNVVQLLHDNNGGFWEHVSRCADNTRIKCATPVEYGPCAYHICLKLCEFDVVYARYDFHTRRCLVLFLGEYQEPEIERLDSQFQAVSDVPLFSIVLAVVNTWLRKVEAARWHLDFATQSMERETGFFGHSPFHEIVRPPGTPKLLSLEQLSGVRLSTATTLASLRTTRRASLCLGDVLQFLCSALHRFRGLENDQLSLSITDHLKEHMTDAISQYHSQQKAQAAQLCDLLSRVNTQWDVAVSLIAKHDQDINIAMAKDTRADSVLMRKIAAVTIIFLPATFMATFFSMIFFDTNGNHSLRVNSAIWLYFVCTIALSLLIVLHFRFSSYWQILLGLSLRDLRQETAPNEEKGKEMNVASLGLPVTNEQRDGERPRPRDRGFWGSANP